MAKPEAERYLVRYRRADNGRMDVWKPLNRTQGIGSLFDEYESAERAAKILMAEKCAIAAFVERASDHICVFMDGQTK